MIKKIGFTMKGLSWSLLLLFAVFMTSCQKDNSTGTQPVPPATLNLTTPLATNTDIDAGPLYMGTAIDFTILAETGISTTGVTSVNGNMGVSPISSTGVTGFGLIADATNVFSRSSLVVGKIFASNYATPTPARMTTAISDMKTAFTRGNGLIRPAPLVNKYAGNISGRTLSPGLYKWSTSLLVTNVGVTLSGLADDVFVFQVAGNLTINNSAIITLQGGLQAKNVFWIVSGKATLGTGVKFSGNILSKTLISVNTGTQVHGRLLAQTAVTLNAATVKPF